jgi:hypothetical protein
MKTFLCAARLGRCILLVASASLLALFLGVWATSVHAVPGDWSGGARGYERPGASETAA